MNPVAAVPAPAEEGEKKEEPVDVIDHVADIPEAPKDNAVVDTNQVAFYWYFTVLLPIN